MGYTQSNASPVPWMVKVWLTQGSSIPMVAHSSTGTPWLTYRP